MEKPSVRSGKSASEFEKRVFEKFTEPFPCAEYEVNLADGKFCGPL